MNTRGDLVVRGEATGCGGHKGLGLSVAPGDLVAFGGRIASKDSAASSYSLAAPTACGDPVCHTVRLPLGAAGSAGMACPAR